MIKATTARETDMLMGIARADSATIEEVYRRYLPGIIRLVESNNGSEADARDIFQEAIVVVYKKCVSRNFELTASLETFLLVVCRNLWRTALRRRSAAIPDKVGLWEDPDQDTMKIMETAAKEQLFYRHFAGLSEKCRQILEMFFNKTSMKEIAAVFGTSESYVKKRKHMCKEQLIEAIKRDPMYKELIP